MSTIQLPEDARTTITSDESTITITQEFEGHDYAVEFSASRAIIIANAMLKWARSTMTEDDAEVERRAKNAARIAQWRARKAQQQGGEA